MVEQPRDTEMIAQLRRYAEAAEQQVPPTPNTPGKRPTIPLVVLAVAATVLLVVGAVALWDGSEQTRITTPADADPDDPTTVTAPTTSCPGQPLGFLAELRADVGFETASAQTTVAEDLRVTYRATGQDAEAQWVQIDFIPNSDGPVPGSAPVADRVDIEMCDPRLGLDHPSALQGLVLDTSRPTVLVDLDPAVLLATGSDGTTTEQLLGALESLRWEPTTTPTTEPTATSLPIGRLSPPLQAAVDEDHLITLDAAGPFHLAQEVPLSDPDLVYHDELSCGFWEPESGISSVGGRQATGSFRVAALYVNDPDYRTASGVGVGTDLASLEDVYGNRLAVDRMDGWESATDGLLALYQDVAAVREGDGALTFLLENDVVTQVKISEADYWGDDEGCL